MHIHCLHLHTFCLPDTLLTGLVLNIGFGRKSWRRMSTLRADWSKRLAIYTWAWLKGDLSHLNLWINVHSRLFECEKKVSILCTYDMHFMDWQNSYLLTLIMQSERTCNDGGPFWEIKEIMESLVIFFLPYDIKRSLRAGGFMPELWQWQTLCWHLSSAGLPNFSGDSQPNKTVCFTQQTWAICT